MFYGAYLNIFKYFIGAYSSRQETSTLFAWDFAIQLFDISAACWKTEHFAWHSFKSYML